MVIDVRDFLKGEVKVKVVEEKEVVVEGSVEQREGTTSTSTKTFRRSFTFPGQIRSEEVTAATSSDGVLTVTVPKKVSLISLSFYSQFLESEFQNKCNHDRRD